MLENAKWQGPSAFDVVSLEKSAWRKVAGSLHILTRASAHKLTSSNQSAFSTIMSNGATPERSSNNDARAESADK